MTETIPDTPTPSFADRVAARAVDVQVVKLILSLLAVPFYVLGFVVAIIWLAIRWCYAAVIVGFVDVTKRGADAG